MKPTRVLTSQRNTPSPNQPGYFNLPISNTQHSGHKGDSADDMDRMHWPTDTAEQLRFFAERLQPEQWLGPSSIAWVSLSPFGICLAKLRCHVVYHLLIVIERMG